MTDKQIVTNYKNILRDMKDIRDRYKDVWTSNDELNYVKKVNQINESIEGVQARIAERKAKRELKANKTLKEIKWVTKSYKNIEVNLQVKQ